MSNTFDRAGKTYIDFGFVVDKKTSPSLIEYPVKDLVQDHL